MEVPQNLEQYRLEKGPPTMYYIPDFLSKDHQDRLQAKIYANNKSWVNLKNRRLQQYGVKPFVVVVSFFFSKKIFLFQGNTRHQRDDADSFAELAGRSWEAASGEKIHM
jgi:hypothetical protein